MLCAMCVSIFDRDTGGVFSTVRGQHHAHIADVEAAAAQGCYLCSELRLDYNHDDSAAELGSHSSSVSFELTTFSINSPSGRLAMLTFESADALLASAGFEIVYTDSIAKPLHYDTFLEQTRADLALEPWRVRADRLPSSSTVVPGSTGDADVLKIAAGWLKTCLETHPECNRSFDESWYPKRLLDLSAADGQRVIVTKDEKPESRYATLSHCWGTNASICCLTSDNLEEWKTTGIPTEVMTRTFCDAIAATRMLGIRYLWIDSLCIMQAGKGSDEDWKEHAVSMRLVYSNSLVNIAAARAESGADGAFTTRSTTYMRPCHVLWKRPLGLPNVTSEPFWTIRRAERHQSQSLRTSPLYTRGWVVQERFLAPRVLHFGKDRIYWECIGLGLVEESFPPGFKNSCPEYDTCVSWAFDLNDKHPQIEDNKKTPGSDFHEIWVRWLDVINGYTGCDLSFPDKDILYAIAGIAERFGQHFDHQYVVGLFRQHLPFDLLWQNKGERSEEYRAPSWSWASIDGQVHFTAEDCPYCDTCCNRFASVEDVHVELVNEGMVYGPVSQAVLTLTGYLWPCRIEAAQEIGTGLRQRMDIHWRASNDDTPPDGPLSHGDPLYWHVAPGKRFPGWSSSLRDNSVIWGEADMDDEDDSIAGFSNNGHFDAWAFPIMEFKQTRNNAYANHWGLLVKKTVDGQYVRLGIYRVRDHIMDRVLADQSCTQQDMCLV